MKLRVAVFVLVLMVISGCTEDPINLGTTVTPPGQTQEPAETNEAETQIPSTVVSSPTSEVIPTELEDTPTEEQGVDPVGGAAELPPRDDLVGLAQYCWQNPESCIGKGDPSAPVVLVEISDYGCGHCRNFNLETAAEIDDLYVQDGDVYWVVLPYALSRERIYAPISALCAAEQDSFSPYHKRMFEIYSDSDALTLEGFDRIAGELGLDVTEFKQCIESGRYYEIVEQNIVTASSLGVRSTPTFVISDQALVGNYPLDAFRQWIDSELDTGG